MALSDFVTSLQSPLPNELTYPLVSLGPDPGDLAAAAQILAAMARRGDVRAALSLAALNAHEHVDVVSGLLARADVDDQPFLRQAVAVLGRPDLVAAGLLDDLRSTNAGVRVGAAVAMSACGLRFAPGLLDALADTSADVRTDALDALVEILGLTPLIRGADGGLDPRSPLRVGWLRLLHPNQAVWASAAARLQRVLGRLMAGASPSSEGLVPAPGAPDYPSRVAAWVEGGQPWDPGLAPTNPTDRAWLAALMLRRCAWDILDTRAIGPLLDLQEPDVDLALDEIAEGLVPDHPFALATASALAQRWSD